MRVILAIVGICGLVGMAYTMGADRRAESGDPLEGFDLDFRARKNIKNTCTEPYGRDQPPPRSCVETQVAALRKYHRMQEAYPEHSVGAKVLKRCWADPGRAKKTDYVAVVTCAERKIARL